jgi:hypothetical protein
MCATPPDLWITAGYPPRRLWARDAASPREHGLLAVEVTRGAVDDGGGKSWQDPAETR